LGRVASDRRTSGLSLLRITRPRMIFSFMPIPIGTNAAGPGSRSTTPRAHWCGTPGNVATRRLGATGSTLAVRAPVGSGCQTSRDPTGQGYRRRAPEDHYRARLRALRLKFLCTLLRGVEQRLMR
jgi:hypothetical protein